MKKWLKGFSMGLLVAFLIFTNVGVYAAGSISQTLDVVLNKVNLNFDGDSVSSIGENYTLSNGEEVPFSILYKGTTYLPIRKVSELFDKELGWDGQTSTISLGDDSKDANNNTIIDLGSESKVVFLERTFNETLGLDIMRESFGEYYFKNNREEVIKAYGATLFYYDITSQKVVEKEDLVDNVLIKPYEPVEYFANENASFILLDVAFDYIQYYTSTGSGDFDKFDNAKMAREYISNNLDQYLVSRVLPYHDELNSALVANKNEPLKFTKTTKTESILGEPIVSLSFKNLTSKSIDAFEADILCYDNFGREVNHYLYQDNKASVIFQSENDYELILSGETERNSWLLSGYTNTTKFEVILKSIHFSDGTIWVK